ncbi:MAG: hypothetical protein PVJ84_01275 [Desulfobacteraceae bacterium]|jgi:hypothetical protein
MLDIAVAYNNYTFLGNEFLTWIWYLIENDEKVIQQCGEDTLDLAVGNKMVLVNRWANGKESITIKGDAVGLEEGLLALSKGALVTDISLIFKSGSLQWQFSIKGESLNFSGIKLPETAAAEQQEDMEGLILDKLYLYEKPFQFIDALYRNFIVLRLSEGWNDTKSNMMKWIQTSVS